MFVSYQQECREGKLRIGQPSLYKASTPWIFNFPTKGHWRDDSKMEYLEEGHQYFIAHSQALEITSIAFPKFSLYPFLEQKHHFTKTREKNDPSFASQCTIAKSALVHDRRGNPIQREKSELCHALSTFIFT
jgi:hypothetical protein